MPTHIADRPSVETFWVDFWGAMDRADYDAIVEALTEDCRWLRADWCEGRTAIRTSLEQRPALLFTRHLVSNLALIPDSRGYACRYTLVIFGAQRSSIDASPPFVTTGPRVAEYHAKIIRSGDRWKISEIRPELLFERP